MSTEKRGCLVRILAFFGLQPITDNLAPNHQIQQIPDQQADNATEIHQNQLSQTDELPYQVTHYFLTRSEHDFYRVLIKTLDGRWLVFPKVGLKDIFYVQRKHDNIASFFRIAQKHVDFLLCHPINLNPVMGIELDGKDHQRRQRREADQFKDKVFAQAGLPLLRIKVRSHYEPLEIQTLINQSLSSKHGNTVSKAMLTHENPMCPNCNIKMVLKTARQGTYAGTQFYGCQNYPRCHVIMPVDTA